MRTIIIGLATAAQMLSGAPPAAEATTREANKKAVLEFYEKGLNQKDFEAASKYLGPRYVQHNPTAPDGAEGFKAFLTFLREKFADSHSEIAPSPMTTTSSCMSTACARRAVAGAPSSISSSSGTARLSSTET
jgi:SnoaL-like polyketide cyclase